MSLYQNDKRFLVHDVALFHTGHLHLRLVCICIYLRSFDSRKGYCLLDVEHVIINIHNTM
jgi:hypothetical protein